MSEPDCPSSTMAAAAASPQGHCRAGPCSVEIGTDCVYSLWLTPPSRAMFLPGPHALSPWGGNRCVTAQSALPLIIIPQAHCHIAKAEASITPCGLGHSLITCCTALEKSVCQCITPPLQFTALAAHTRRAAACPREYCVTRRSLNTVQLV